MTADEKRKAYYAIPGAMRKECGEMRAAERPWVDPDTPKNEKPPMPDISCSSGGRRLR